MSAFNVEEKESFNEDEVLLVKRNYEFLISIYKPISRVVAFEQKTNPNLEEITDMVRNLTEYKTQLKRKRKELKNQKQNERVLDTEALNQFLDRAMNMSSNFNSTVRKDRRKFKDMFDRALGSTM